MATFEGSLKNKNYGAVAGIRSLVNEEVSTFEGPLKNKNHGCMRNTLARKAVATFEDSLQNKNYGAV